MLLSAVLSAGIDRYLWVAAGTPRGLVGTPQGSAGTPPGSAYKLDTPQKNGNPPALIAQ